MNTPREIHDFLILNGWEYSYSDEEEDRYYEKKNCFSVCLNTKEKEITYLNDNGDCYCHDFNIYTMIGFLFHMRQIGCNYKFPWTGEMSGLTENAL